LSKEHHRRDGYWKGYHLAHTLELDSVVRDIVGLVKESKPPAKPKRTSRGRRTVHSWEKLVCICLLMVMLGLTFRDMQSMAPRLDLPWDEPYPDHSTIHRAYHRIPVDYLESILDKTAHLCIREAGWRRGLIASDSSGVETDRYEEVVRPNKKSRCFEVVRRRLYLKYHIIAILDHLIILKAKITSYRCADSLILRSMLKAFRALPGSIFNGDTAYDAELNFQRIYQLSMHPNIKQRTIQNGKKGKGRKRLHYRSRAAKEFDEELYHYRGIVEAIFGAEESDEHNLRTRFRLREHREKWGQILAIGWNLKVLNRLRCTRHLGIEVTPLIRN